MNTHTYVKTKYKDLLAAAAMNGKSVYENELIKLSNLKAVRNQSKSHVSIQYLFKTYWDAFFAEFKHKLRPTIIKNVEAMIACKDLSKGYLFYECTSCYNYHLTGLSCHSRFCPSCGHKYRDERSIEIQKKLLNVPHRHFVFSVPFDMRPYFWKCRQLFDCLFQTVNQALTMSIRNSKRDHQTDVRLGFISFLHTSGRPLNLHPHLHVLLAEQTIDKTGKSKPMFFFPFERLRKTFMYLLLTNVSKCLKLFATKSLYHDFNKLRTKLIKQYQNGFYVNGPKISEENTFYSSKKIADYISRYASHPPIAESNILSLDEETHQVTWVYTPHEDPAHPIKITEPVFSFIRKLIRHIHDYRFHQLRYYGFYANRSLRSAHKVKMVSAISIHIAQSRLKWRILLLKTFKFDPLICYCGSKMVLNLKHSYLNHNKEYISDA